MRGVLPRGTWKDLPLRTLQVVNLCGLGQIETGTSGAVFITIGLLLDTEESNGSSRRCQVICTHLYVHIYMYTYICTHLVGWRCIRRPTQLTL